MHLGRIHSRGFHLISPNPDQHYFSNSSAYGSSHVESLLCARHRGYDGVKAWPPPLPASVSPSPSAVWPSLFSIWTAPTYFFSWTLSTSFSLQVQECLRNIFLNWQFRPEAGVGGSLCKEKHTMWILQIWIPSVSEIIPEETTWARAHLQKAIRPHKDCTMDHRTQAMIKPHSSEFNPQVHWLRKRTWGSEGENYHLLSIYHIIQTLYRWHHWFKLVVLTHHSSFSGRMFIKCLRWSCTMTPSVLI